MTRFRVHPLAVVVVCCALIVGFFCGVTYAAALNVGEGMPVKSSYSVRFSSPAPRDIWGGTSDMAGKVQEWNESRWWHVVAEDMTVEAQRESAPEVHRTQASEFTVPSGSSGTGDCTGYPAYVPIQRESGGNPDAVNSSSGAMGCAQLMPMHFRAGGTCADLPISYDGQRECAWRLPQSAWAG